MKTICRLFAPLFLLVILNILGTQKLKAQAEVFIDGPIQQLDYNDPRFAGLSMVGMIPIGSFNPTNDVYFANFFMYVQSLDSVVWLIQNFPIPPDNLALGPGQPYLVRHVEFNLDPLHILDANNPQAIPDFPVSIPQLTLQPYLEPILYPSFPTNFFPAQVVVGPYDIISTNPIIEINASLLFGLIPPTTLLWHPPIIIPAEYEWRGCNVPSLDLNSTANPATADYAGDLNACVPTATANSFMWLRGEHPKIDSLLNLAHGDDSTTHRKTLKDLSGIMNRAPNSGVFPGVFARAKQTFADKHKLPVKVKYQSIFLDNDFLSANDTYGHFADNQNSERRTVDPCWVMDELKDDEDVEMNFDCYWVDSLGNFRPNDPATPQNESFLYSHCVVLTDGYKIQAGPDSNYIIGFGFKHDSSQRAAGGTIQEHSWIKSFTSAGGTTYSYLEQKSTTRRVFGGITYRKTCLISSVMSESFDDTVTYDTIPCPTNKTMNGDTICSGVIKADTICLSNITIKGGQDVLFKCDVFKMDDEFTQLMPTSTIRVDISGCD